MDHELGCQEYQLCAKMSKVLTTAKVIGDVIATEIMIALSIVQNFTHHQLMNSLEVRIMDEFDKTDISCN